MDKFKNSWNPSTELFYWDKNPVGYHIILMDKSSGKLVCCNENEKLFLSEGYPPYRWDLIEATEWLAGQSDYYLFKLIKRE